MQRCPAKKLINIISDILINCKILRRKHTFRQYNMTDATEMKDDALSAKHSRLLELLSIAAGPGDSRAVDRATVLIKQGTDINTPCPKRGCSALTIASVNGNIPVVALLIRNDADVDARNIAGLTALGCIVYGSRRAIVKTPVEDDKDIINRLLDAGADITIEDEKGETPLDIARGIARELATYDNNQIVELLEAHVKCGGGGE